MKEPHLIEEDGIGWRCSECGYFHRGDPTYEEPPGECEDCGARFNPELLTHHSTSYSEIV
jgi:rubrerythrin